MKSGSTGTTDSVVNQNLDQAFATTTNSSTKPSGSNTASNIQTTLQEEDAVEVANQNSAGTTISQQSNDIVLKTTPSDPQRASAVCK